VKTLYTNKKYDPDNAHYSHARKALGSVEVVTDRREFVWLHPDDQKDWTELGKTLNAQGLMLSNASTDERIWVVRTYSDVSRGAFYVFNRDTRKLTPLGEVTPWLNPEMMSPMKTVNYRTRDGLDIQGYLTLPRGKEAKNLPVVVNVHGGPWARDEWGFDPEAQLLASRGYAVFQMNFRGSTGYGRKFWEKSFKQWGRAMHHRRRKVAGEGRRRRS
jgi:dipeptidyl aminopeptidase/acylaminoacyl peptidase